MENKDILYLILGRLEISDLVNCSKTCKRVKEIYNDDIFWLYKLGKEFPDFNLLRFQGSFKEKYKLIYFLMDIKEKLDRKETVYELYDLKELDIQNSKLAELPSSIGYLFNLEKINLIHNKLRRLPYSIGKLTNLKYLNLCGNQLIEIPSSLENLHNLEFLNLNSNFLTETPSLGNLDTLNLSNNYLTEIPSFENFKLRKLTLINNKIKKIPDSIGNLTNLVELHLTNNNLTEIPKSLLNLDPLTKINIQYNYLLKEIPIEIVERFPFLRYGNTN